MGGSLFRARGWVPVPLLLGLLWVARPPGPLLAPALALLLAGEALRLWGVAWIGPRSRTRTAQVGSMVTQGPYRWCRNPLYLGNLTLLAGVGLLSGRAWAALLVTALMAVHYHLIVRWEEARLREALGAPYVAWCATVPRWGWPPRRAPAGEGRADWLGALRSERSTLLAIGLSAGAILVKGVGWPG